MQVSVSSGTESGTLAARNPTAADRGGPGEPGGDPDLTKVVAGWPALPEATRQSILAMVREAAAGADAEGAVE